MNEVYQSQAVISGQNLSWSLTLRPGVKLPHTGPSALHLGISRTRLLMLYNVVTDSRTSQHSPSAFFLPALMIPMTDVCNELLTQSEMALLYHRAIIYSHIRVQSELFSVRQNALIHKHTSKFKCLPLLARVAGPATVTLQSWFPPA
ncbi:hypothetical protein CEXT_448631 [Caerostris extrusa]|uniref:Uncharacterized protein n=1 Tax=Caerostris extrusa TaxID=172846 RepID=A0AAV4UW55_CAEEX|nr:hypothetical protein CEXT_448631 [Caerostris extrusa]